MKPFGWRDKVIVTIVGWLIQLTSDVHRSIFTSALNEGTEVLELKHKKFHEMRGDTCDHGKM